MTAEGEKQSAILKAEGQAQSAILRAEGESRAILEVFDAIHRGNADPKLLAYQYLQTLPQIANGTSSKIWVVPTKFTAALSSITAAFGTVSPSGDEPTGVQFKERGTSAMEEVSLQDPREALAEARQEVQAATREADRADTGPSSGRVPQDVRPAGNAVQLDPLTEGGLPL